MRISVFLAMDGLCMERDIFAALGAAVAVLVSEDLDLLLLVLVNGLSCLGPLAGALTHRLNRVRIEMFTETVFPLYSVPS